MPAGTSIRASAPPPSPQTVRYDGFASFGVSQLGCGKASLAAAFSRMAQPAMANGLKLVIDEYGC